jgi:hypothetical protein
MFKRNLKISHKQLVWLRLVFLHWLNFKTSSFKYIEVVSKGVKNTKGCLSERMI